MGKRIDLMFTDKEIKDIKRRYKKRENTQTELAKKYEVCRKTIYKIIQNIKIKCRECNIKYKSSEFKLHNHGKNVNVPVRFGKENGMYGRRHTKEAKKIMSKTHKGKKISQEQKDYYSNNFSGKNNPRFGKKHTKEARRKISLAHMGIKISFEQKKEHSEYMKKLWELGVYDKTAFRLYYKPEGIQHFVRSTWEANFARILNYLGIKYKYEPIRINTPYGSYTPDFYIPNRKYFVEVKGAELNNKQKRKRNYLRKKGIVIKMVNEKVYRVLTNRYKYHIEGWD